LIDALEADPSVAYAEPNMLRYLSAVPTDPSFANQWSLDNSGQSHSVSGSTSTRPGVVDADIDAVEAWDNQLGSEDTVIAIMDSGVDIAHPDLAGSLWTNPGEIASNGVDDDGNGYRDDVHGWDFADNDAELIQATGGYEGWDHGTHVAGIVAGTANNGIGGSGVCPSCKLMVLKIFEPFDTDDNGSLDTMVGDVAAELKAFDYAISMGADIINGSFGGSIVSVRSERARMKKAIAAGITMVLAAGNENGDNDLLIPGLDFDGDGVMDSVSPAYPASYDLEGILAVAASNDSDQNGYQSACFAALMTREWPCSFTSWGHDSVDVSAPGVDIASTVPSAGYDTWDGTSMAAPVAAGIAGLVLSEHPTYSPAQVVNAIMNSVDAPSSLNSLLAFPGQPATGEFTTTAGRVNAVAALTASPVDAFPRTDGNIRGARAMSGIVSGSVSWPEDANDVFKKRLESGVRYKAILNTTGSSDLDLQIYRPGTTEIWQFDDRCFGGSACPVLFYEPTDSGDVTVRFRAPKTGTYYFHVNAWVLNSAGYSLKVAKA
jgi:subtilisin family serine protease